MIFFVTFLHQGKKVRKKHLEHVSVPSRQFTKRYFLLFFFSLFVLTRQRGEKSQGGANHAQRRQYSD
jgi:hypothetical protein